MMDQKRFCRWTTAFVLGVLLLQASPVWAQAGTALGQQTLGAPTGTYSPRMPSSGFSFSVG